MYYYSFIRNTMWNLIIITTSKTYCEVPKQYIHAYCYSNSFLGLDAFFMSHSESSTSHGERETGNEECHAFLRKLSFLVLSSIVKLSIGRTYLHKRLMCFTEKQSLHLYLTGCVFITVLCVFDFPVYALASVTLP